MNNIEDSLTDEDFNTVFDSTVVASGKYKVRLLKGKPRIKVSKAGNRYLTFAMVADSTEDGEKVNSKIIYHSIPFEGLNKRGDSNKGMFAGFFKALGLEKEQVKEMYSNLLETAPAAAEIGDREEVSLLVGGDVFDASGRFLMASVKEDEWNGVIKNVIGSVWEVKE